MYRRDDRAEPGRAQRHRPQRRRGAHHDGCHRRFRRGQALEYRRRHHDHRGASHQHLERRQPDGRRPEPADGRLHGKDAGRTRGVVGLADRRRPLVADHVGRADHRGADDAAAGKRQHRRRQGSGRKVAA
ncbi:hypothetical protein G6F31_020323 [Rhizopus arrhizus]|nr:hypothetical protein G6F31_020323 [Rhizopus arrhizus]